jgi:uncharacterized membrane protein YsdA (DUF1294 family)
MMKIILTLFLALNLITFFVYGIDKWKAKRGEIAAIIGGLVLWLYRL